MSETDAPRDGTQTMRKKIRDVHEATLTIAFEEVNRVLDRIESLKADFKVNDADAGVSDVASLASEVEKIRASLISLGQAARAEIAAVEKRGVLNVAESVREGAKQAGIDGAVEGYIGVEKKAIAQINEAVTAFKAKLDALQAAADTLKQATHEKPASGVSLAGLLVSLAVAVGAVLGGVWLMQKPPTDPAVAFFQSLTPEQQTQVWRVLPHDAQLRINQAYQQAKQ